METILYSIWIGAFVAIFLLNTGLGLKSIELCKECLIFLNDILGKKEEPFFKRINYLICKTMFLAYRLIFDYKNAIEYGKKLRLMLHENGETAKEGVLTVALAVIYEQQCKHAEAEMMYERAIGIIIETGDRLGLAATYEKLANLSYCLSNYAKAREYFNKALAIRMEIGDRKGEALDNENLGNVFQCLGNYVKAKECQDRALAISKEICDRYLEATAYLNLGSVFLYLGEYCKAKEYLERSLAIKIEIGDRKGEAATYGNLGAVFQCLGDYFKAKEYHERALLIRIETGDRDGEAEDYRNLGEVFQLLGDYVKAKEYLEKALGIRIEIADRNGQAVCYINLGIVFQSLSEYVKAKEYLAKALAIKTEIADRHGEAACHGNLGNVFGYLGEYAKAKESLEKALAITIEIGDRKAEAAAYGNLGALFQSCGEHVKAKENLQKALAIKIEIGDRKGEAATYGNLGTVFQSLGEYVKAKAYLEKALAIRIGIGDRNGEAVDYGHLGNMFRCVGDYAKAIEYLQKALVIKIEIGDRKGQAADYGNLGAVFQRLGDYVKAKEYLEKALAIRMEIGDRRGEGADYGNLGAMFSTLGEYVKAKAYLEKALAVRIEVGDRSGEAADYGNLGILFRCLGEYTKATKYLEKSLLISRDIKDGGQEFQYLCNLALVKLHEEKIQEAVNCLQLIIKKSERLRGFLQGNEEFEISFLDVYLSPYQNLSKLFCLAGSPKDALYVEELGRARALTDLMANHYSLENKLISGNLQSWLGIENIMTKERSCACLYLSYFDQDVHLWIIKTSGFIDFRQKTVTEDLFCAGLVPKLDEFFAKSFRSFGILPEGNCEDRSLNKVETNLKSPQEKSDAALRIVEEDDEDCEPYESSLLSCYRMLISPVAELIGNEEAEIIIVPHRFLYKVPFAALHDENGKYLSETFRLRIVPSLTTLKLIQDSPAGYHSDTGALVVGDPKVGCVFYRGSVENFKPLKYARAEAMMVGRLMSVQPLLGKEATKQAVLDRIHSVSLVHFAAHGNAERGEIALAPTTTTGTEVPDEEDYLLTMSDIARGQLQAKLVVLSCCHSGRGHIKAEGVVGIARAFLGSGARSVLVARWALEDKATEQFMRRFYEHLVDGESASESLHEAMKWMRGNGFASVDDWAPFMLIGDNVTLQFGK